MSYDFPQICIYGLIDPRSGQIRYIGQTARGGKSYSGLMFEGG